MDRAGQAGTGCRVAAGMGTALAGMMAAGSQVGVSYKRCRM